MFSAASKPSVAIITLRDIATLPVHREREMIDLRLAEANHKKWKALMS
jgi:hypothetical protein